MIFHACAKRGGALSRYILNVEIFVTSHAHEPRAAFVERRCGAPVRDARVVLNEALEHAEQVEQVARVPEQSTMRHKFHGQQVPPFQMMGVARQMAQTRMSTIAPKSGSDGENCLIGSICKVSARESWTYARDRSSPRSLAHQLESAERKGEMVIVR